jgi:hypothetical protein
MKLEIGAVLQMRGGSYAVLLLRRKELPVVRGEPMHEYECVVLRSFASRGPGAVVGYLESTLLQNFERIA